MTYTPSPSADTSPSTSLQSRKDIREKSRQISSQFQEEDKKEKGKSKVGVKRKRSELEKKGKKQDKEELKAEKEEKEESNSFSESEEDIEEVEIRGLQTQNVTESKSITRKQETKKRKIEKSQVSLPILVEDIVKEEEKSQSSKKTKLELEEEGKFFLLLFYSRIIQLTSCASVKRSAEHFWNLANEYHLVDSISINPLLLQQPEQESKLLIRLINEDFVDNLTLQI